MNIINALEIAIQEETAAMNKYNHLAGEAEDTETRLMFEQIAREECSHLKILKERLKSIKFVL